MSIGEEILKAARKQKAARFERQELARTRSEQYAKALGWSSSDIEEVHGTGMIYVGEGIELRVDEVNFDGWIPLLFAFKTGVVLDASDIPLLGESDHEALLSMLRRRSRPAMGHAVAASILDVRDARMRSAEKSAERYPKAYADCSLADAEAVLGGGS